MLSREQIYAERAYACINSIFGEGQNQKGVTPDDYAIAAKNLPSLILSVGLVQAVHFTSSRNSSTGRLVSDLAGVVDEADILNAARTKPVQEYILLTEKCLTASKWLKRFVDIHAKHLSR